MVGTGGTQTCVHLHVSRPLYHCAKDADKAKSVCMPLCLPEIPLTRASFALHRHIIPIWNQDPRNENLPFSFEAEDPVLGYMPKYPL